MLTDNQHIDKARWDDLILQAPEGNIFGASWYLDAAFPRWKALIAENYSAGFVIPEKHKYGLRVALNPMFVRQLGPYQQGGYNAELFRKQVRQCLAKYSVYRLQSLRNETCTKFREKIYQRLQIDKSGSYEENTRRNIKKAVQKKLSIAVVAPFTVVDIFKKNKGGELGVFHEEDFKKLERTFNACVQHNAGEGYAAVSEEGEIMAAGFFSFFKDTVTYLNGSATEAGRKSGAMHFLLNAVMDLHRGAYRYMDFGGSSVPGVARLYRSFGSEDMIYYYCTGGWAEKLVRAIKFGR